MCGMAGVFTANGADRRSNGAGLRCMIDRLVPRGPDEGEFFIETSIAFAFRRLSVVGGKAGRQPITSADQSVTLMANGEIYNHRELRQALGHHRFLGTSDIEVLLHLYSDLGLEAFRKLHGMFACALWDTRTRTLTLVRDRFGIKPLFYHRNANRVIFASETKALLAYPDCPRSFDWTSALANPWLNEDLVFCGEPPPTFFHEIESVPAGGYVQISAEGLKVNRGFYWRFPGEPSTQCSQAEQLVAEYHDALLESCRDCLQCESPTGIMLSGGIDSAVIAAIAARDKLPAETFTVLCESTMGNGDAETAQRFSQEFGLENHQVLINWNDENISPELWIKINWISENPSCGPEQLYKYLLLNYARSAFPHLKVMLSGQGSDEFNGGYSRQLACWGSSSWSGALKSIREIQQHTYHRLLQDRFLAWEREEPLLHQRFLKRLTGRSGPLADPWEMYQRSKLHDLELFNLWHEDRLCSHFGMEGRVPFLDHRIVEVCGRVPARLRRRLFWDKQILRSAASSLLPQRYTQREKVPFFYGTHLRSTQNMIINLLRKNGHQLIEHAFPRCSNARAVVNVSALLRSIDNLTVEPDPAFQLLRLVNMGLLEQCSKEASLAHNEIPHPAVCRVRTEHEETRKLMAARSSTDAVRSRIFTQSSGCVLTKSLDSEIYYLISDGRVRHCWDENDARRIRLLQALDGLKTLSEIFPLMKIEEPEILRYLEEGIEEGYVEEVCNINPEENRIAVNH